MNDLEQHVICVLHGGPMRKISVGGKIIEFEMHPYCGPTILNRNGDPLKHQPLEFLKAASLWAQQGRKIENGLCVWYHEPKEILKHFWRPTLGNHGLRTPNTRQLMNALEQYVHALGLNADDVMNRLVLFGIISDNAASLADVANVDCERAVEFLVSGE